MDEIFNNHLQTLVRLARKMLDSQRLQNGLDIGSEDSKRLAELVLELESLYEIHQG